MAAPARNDFWRARARHGRAARFPDPQSLWRECCGYFEWVEANPLKKAKPACRNGAVTLHEVPRMRPMTIAGLCAHLGIGQQTWRDYYSKQGFSGVTEKVRAIVRTQKFEGAAAGLLSPKLVAQEMSLGDIIGAAYLAQTGTRAG